MSILDIWLRARPAPKLAEVPSTTIDLGPILKAALAGRSPPRAATLSPEAVEFIKLIKQSDVAR